MKSIVIGGSGLVGSNLVRRFRSEGFDVVGTYRTSPADEAGVAIDKRDQSAVSDLITDADPDAVIDLAAFHEVDECERQRDKAWSVNAAGTRNIAVAAESAGAHFVFLSTDYVFPGDPSKAPYTEEDPVRPMNYYGQTKYAGEQAAKIASDWTVLRSSVLYGTSSENFLTWALRNLRDREEVDIVDDQRGSVTYAGDIAEACIKTVDRKLTGLFHASGPESLTRYEFTRRLAEAFGYPPDHVNPISTEELDQRAIRPRDSSLDSTKLYEAIDYTFQDSKAALSELSE